MLVNMNEILLDAQKKKYAVGLFNTTDTDALEAAISAAVPPLGLAVNGKVPRTITFFCFI